MEIDATSSKLEAALYLVSTPIGNMEDITLRAVRILQSADAVYCEDTRNSSHLMEHIGAKKPLISCHEHNERQRGAEIALRVAAGEAIAYISDAGMPGISDPGRILAEECIKANAAVTAVPGANAALTALTLSGFDAACACFVGFLPRENGERRKLTERLKTHLGALIIYESPLRAADTLGFLAQALGERRAALARELTKKFEEIRRGTLSSLAQGAILTPPRGECVIIVEGAPEPQKLDEAQAKTLIAGLISSGLSAKDAAKRAAEAGFSKNEAYRLALELKEKEAL